MLLAQLTGLREALRGYEESHKTNSDALAALNEEWARKDKNYNDAMERLRREIEVLGQALDYLNAQE